MTRIDDPVLRAQLVAEIHGRAKYWVARGLQWAGSAYSRTCGIRAAVLEQLANDLEAAARDEAGRAARNAT